MNLSLPRRDGVERIGAQVIVLAQGVQLQPVGVKRHRLHVEAIGPERVVIAVADCLPVDELDGQFEGGLGLADELVLVEAQHAVEDVDLRDGGFADPHRADGLGLDQGDAGLAVLGQEAAQGGGGHPAGGAAADDDDAAQAVVDLHAVFSKLLSIIGAPRSSGR
jgi:hypothetical protein